LSFFSAADASPGAAAGVTCNIVVSLDGTFVNGFLSIGTNNGLDAPSSIMLDKVTTMPRSKLVRASGKFPTPRRSSFPGASWFSCASRKGSSTHLEASTARDG